MRAWIAGLIAVMMVVAPVSNVAAQGEDPPDVERDLNEYFDRVEDYDVVQESENHYVIVAPLPASAFRPNVSQTVVVPAGSLDVQGQDDKDNYEIRVKVSPERVEAGDSSLWETAWELEAEVANRTWNDTLPSIGEYRQLVDPTANMTWATINETHEEIIQLRRNLTELLFTAGPDGQIPGVPGSDDSALVEEQARTLNRTLEDLNWTLGQIQNVSDVWMPENLNAFERVYEGVSAVSSDLEPVTGRNLSDDAHPVREKLREVENASRDARDQAYQLWHRAWMLAQDADNATDGDLPETCEWWEDECATEYLYGEVYNLTQTINDTAPVDIGEFPNASDVNDTVPCMGNESERRDVCTVTLPCSGPDRSKHCPGDDEGGEEDDGGDDDESDDSENGTLPTVTLPLEYPSQAEDPADDELDELWSLAEALRKADNGSYETYDWFWEQVNFTRNYAKTIDDRAAETMVLVNDTYRHYDESARETINGQLGAAREDLDRVQEILGLGDDDNEDEEGDCEEGNESCSSGVNEAIPSIEDAEEHLNDALAFIDETQKDVRQGPAQYARDRVDQATEHPTQIRIYLPKDLSDLEPTLGDVPQDLPDDTPDTDNVTNETPVNEDEVKEDLDPTNDPDEDDAGNESDNGTDDGTDDGSDDSSDDTSDDSDDSGSDDGSGDSGSDDSTGDSSSDDGTDDSSSDDNGTDEGTDADFTGTVDPDEVLMATGQQDTVRLSVTNEGDEEQTYQLTAQDHGPITADAGGDSELTLAPGEEGILEVRVSATDPGSGELELQVTDDTGAKQTWVVPVEIAESESEDAIRVDLDPTSLEMRNGDDSFADVWIANDGDQVVQVELFPRTKGPLVAENRDDSTLELDPGERETVTIQLSGEEPGKASLTVDIDTDNGDGLRPTMTVEVTGDTPEEDDAQAAADGLETRPGGASSDDGAGTEGSGDPDASGSSTGDSGGGADGQAGAYDANGVPSPGVVAMLAVLGLAAVARARRRG